MNSVNGANSKHAKAEGHLRRSHPLPRTPIRPARINAVVRSELIGVGVPQGSSLIDHDRRAPRTLDPVQERCLETKLPDQFLLLEHRARVPAAHGAQPKLDALFGLPADDPLV